MKVKLRDIEPNPFRDATINADRKKALVESIERTGFWPNLIGRRRNGKVELAYGHHRLAALRELFTEDSEFDITIVPLTDDEMHRILVDENDYRFHHDANQMMEALKATIKAIDAGAIKIEIPQGRGAHRVKHVTPGGQRFSAQTIAGLLNWPQTQASAMIGLSEALERRDISRADLVGLTPSQAYELARLYRTASSQPVSQPRRREIVKSAADDLRTRKKTLRAVRGDARRMLKGPSQPPDIERFTETLARRLDSVLDSSDIPTRVQAVAPHLDAVSKTNARALRQAALRLKKNVDKIVKQLS